MNLLRIYLILNMKIIEIHRNLQHVFKSNNVHLHYEKSLSFNSLSFSQIQNDTQVMSSDAISDQNVGLLPLHLNV